MPQEVGKRTARARMCPVSVQYTAHWRYQKPVTRHRPRHSDVLSRPSASCLLPRYDQSTIVPNPLNVGWRPHPTGTMHASSERLSVHTHGRDAHQALIPMVV